MRIFCTGASGYIGGSNAVALAAAGHEVSGLAWALPRQAQRTCYEASSVHAATDSALDMEISSDVVYPDSCRVHPRVSRGAACRRRIVSVRVRRDFPRRLQSHRSFIARKRTHWSQRFRRESALSAPDKRKSLKRLITFGVRVTRRHIDELCAILPRYSCRR